MKAIRSIALYMRKFIKSWRQKRLISIVGKARAHFAYQ